MFKKIFSYFVPITIYQQKSSLSKNLEITWSDGKLVLDSKNTNYSYGSLQRILRKGLQSIGFDSVLKMNEILILGVAGGSVIKTLVNEIRFKGKITGVEIDREIIKIANDYFKLKEVPNLKIVIDDAFEFVLKTNKKYDLIIIDIFQDTLMPNFLFENFFIERLKVLLPTKGIVLFNTLMMNEKDQLRNKQYIAATMTLGFQINKVLNLDGHNQIIIFEKK